MKSIDLEFMELSSGIQSAFYIFGFMAAIALLQNLLKKNSLYSKNVKKN